MVIEKTKTLGQLLNEYHGPKIKQLMADRQVRELLQIRIEIAEAFKDQYSVDTRVDVRSVQRTLDILFPLVKEVVEPGCGGCVTKITNRIIASIEANTKALKALDSPDPEIEEKPIKPTGPTEHVPEARVPGTYVYILVKVRGIAYVHFGVAKREIKGAYQSVENLSTNTVQDVLIEDLYINPNEAQSECKGYMAEWAMLHPGKDHQPEPTNQPEAQPQTETVAQPDDQKPEPPSQNRRGIRVGTMLTNGEAEARVATILEDRYIGIIQQDGQDTELPILFEEIGKQWSKLPPTK